MLSINSPRLMEDTSNPWNLEYLNFITNAFSLCNLCVPLCLWFAISNYHRDTEEHRDCTEKRLRGLLTVLACFSQIVVNHAATIFLRFRDRSVTTLFVTTDLVFRIQAFEHEFARGDELGYVGAPEVERDHCGFE